MKRLFLLAAIITLPFFANAQIDGGELFLSGTSNFSVAYGTRAEGTVKTFGVALSPRVGKALSPNVVLGGEFNFGYNSMNVERDGGDTSESATSVGLGPFVRYYFAPSQVSPYFEAGFGLGKSWSEDNVSANLFYGDLGLGVSIFLNESVALDAGLNYNYSRSKLAIEDVEYEPTTAGVVSLSLGISCFID